MFLEIVASIILIAVVKACCSVNWITAGQDAYSKPGQFFWIKKWIFYVVYLVRKFYINRRRKLETNRSCDPKSTDCWENQDRVQPLLRHADAADTVQFTAMAESGRGVGEDTTLMLKLTKRQRGQAELCLYIQVPGHGFLQLPSHPDTIVCNASSGDETTYTAAGVRIEINEPMRQWRISFHGMMRMVDTLKEPTRWAQGKNLVYVKFGFTWTAYSSPYHFSDRTHVNLLSEAVAREFWTFNFFSKMETFRRQHSHYEQWGQLKGTLFVDGMEEGPVGRELTLRGVRSHSFGLHNGSSYHRYMRVSAHLKNGLSLSVTVACINDVLTHVVSGYLVQADRRLYRIISTDLCLWQHGENGEIPDIIQFNVATENHKCNVVCLLRLKPELHNGLEWKGRTHHCLADIYVNSQPGRGTIEMYYRTPKIVCPLERDQEPPPFSTKFPSTDLTKLTLCLAEHSCQNAQLTGSAGSQLACLKALTTNRNVGEFYVMEGFCITAHALSQHIEANPELRQLLNSMEEHARSESNDELRDICSRCYTGFLASTLPDELVADIGAKIRNLANLNRHCCAQVVVRSSVVGDVVDEEAELHTCTDVTGMKQVLTAILKCWGNQCSFDVVHQRRQCGLAVFPPMGVIVQAMLEDSRSTGCITTCDPNSGDPSTLLINANYVMTKVTTVDQSQPDRIVLRRCDDDSFRVVSQSIGLKQKITNHDKRGSKTRRVSVDYVQECCLSYDTVLRLGELADDLKNMFQSHREIYWTTARGKIYLTRCDEFLDDLTESNYEDVHEFDSAYGLDSTWTMSSKATDVFPDPATPLTLSTVVRAVAKGFQVGDNLPDDNSPFPEMVASVSCGHSLINMHDLLPPCNLSTLLNVDLAELRSKLDETSLHEYHNSPSSFLSGLSSFWQKIALFLDELNDQRPEMPQRTTGKNDLDLDDLPPQKLHRMIGDKLLPSITHVIRCHVACCKKFEILRQMLLFVLSGSRSADSWSTYNADVAALLASRSDDVAKEIPDLLHHLAEAITDAGFKEKFVAMKPLKAVVWLNGQQSGQVKDLYEEFLNKHGHRCLSELELREESWYEDQTKIVTVLQVIVDSNPARKPSSAYDVEAAILQLQAPLNSFQRCLLKFLLPWLRRAVSERAKSKSLQVMRIDELKSAYRKLAKTLKTEGHLPDEDLLCFLTHWEVGKLIRSRSSISALVSRAVKRRHVYSKQKNLMFPDISKGQPHESIVDVHSSAESIPFNTVLQGAPVCAGKVRAPVRIVADQSEAFLIQAGEILIVKNPDIGWSPYYPLVVGLITEVGHISSHGALLAANYGLPCVVNVKQATKCFKTGDIVWLDGANGTVQRASPRLTREESALLLA